MLVAAIGVASAAFDTLPFAVVPSLGACTPVAAAAVFETVHTLAVVVEVQKLFVVALAHKLASVDHTDASDVPESAAAALTVVLPFLVAAVVLPFLVAAVVLPFLVAAVVLPILVVAVVLPIPAVAVAADADERTFEWR